LEVAQVLCRHAGAGALTPTRAREALLDLHDLDIQRYGHDVLLERIWALRHNCTAYDAAYLALAEALDAPLLTFDRGLAGVPGATAEVEVLD
jgi:predicted nucleic acid-binding protein